MDANEQTKQEAMVAMTEEMKRNITTIKGSMADIEKKVTALVGMETHENADMLLLGTLEYLSQATVYLARDLSNTIREGYAGLQQSFGFQPEISDDVPF